MLDTIAGLARVIAQTPEFKALRDRQANIALHPAIVKALTELENTRGRLYGGRVDPEEAEALVQKLDDGYARLGQNPQAAAYFTAAERFEALMDYVSERLRESLDSIK